MPEPRVSLVELSGIVKRYAGITALDDVGLVIRPGEAVSLAGENGSGKSTLIKVLSGVERPNAGTIRVDGQLIARMTPRQAAAAGIMVIFQDFALFPNLTVAENIAISAELASGAQVYSKARAREKAMAALARVGADLNPNALVETLSVAHKQLVAICRALAADARLIIMDEPTTALTEREVRSLLKIIRRLKADGVAILFVSHKLAEVLEVCEEVVVLRNGRKVAAGPARDFDAASLSRHMTGRDIDQKPPKPFAADAPVLFEVKGLTKRGAFEDVSFSLRAGEVLGISGLMGSGRTSLAKAFFGLVTPEAGEMRLNGKPVRTGDPVAAARAGIGYVPEDRLTEGLFLTQSILHNVAVGRADDHTRMGVMDQRSAWSEAVDWLRRFSVKAPDPDAAVRSLSGGNQQRVVLARWLSRAPDLLVLNGPSVGVDVGSKAEIHEIIADLSARGLGVIVISDDLPELLATCHRLLVMVDGRVTDDIPGDEISEAELAHRLAS